MSEKLQPVRCGCGGEPVVGHIEKTSYVPKDRWYIGCPKCDICTGLYDTEAEVVEAWNKAMGERTAKAIEHDASITDTDGYKYQRSEYLCGNCKKKVIGGDEYCSHCGSRLIWDEDIPMEYFESGGK